MELTQVGRRIVIRHWRLIAFYVAIVVAAVTVIELAQPTKYTADARLVLDTQDPTTRQEAAAVADTAQALATSPGQVGAALKRAGISDRDPATVARDAVTVQSLGSSGLLKLSVRDSSPEHAVSIANALAAAVIQTRLGFTRAGSLSVLRDLNTRLAALGERISTTEAKIAALNARAAAPGAQPGALSAARDAAQRERQSLVEQQGVLESERVSSLTAASSKPKPEIFSAATKPAHADPSELPVHLVLGVLLGLILGVGLAALLETLRPTVVGGDAVAREFDAPLLGTLPAPPDTEKGLKNLSRVTSRLSVAMGAARVPRVRLLAAGPEIDLRPLAARIDAVGSQVPVAAYVPARVGSAVGAPNGTAEEGTALEHGWAPFSADAAPVADASSTNGHGAGGVVVVAPSSLKLTEITETTELLRIVPAAVIGVITYAAPRRRTSRTSERD